MTAKTMISVADLLFTYHHQGFRLLVPDFAIGEAERVAITGPSGSGKTTLINLLAGILVPTQGRVGFTGLDLTTMSAEDRQDVRIARMGLVFQEFELLEYLSVIDNILLPFRITPILELNDTSQDLARRLASETGLGDKLQRFPHELSQGERQRVAVCRALVTRPAILLGDEPTANLDQKNRDLVMDMFFMHAEETGAPLVVITHDHEVLDRFDRTIDVSGFVS